MKRIYFTVMCLVLMSFISSAQDIPDWLWKSPITRVYQTGEYNGLPTADNNYVNRNTTTHVIVTPIGQFSVAPSIRPYPHTATQSEVDAVNMGGNTTTIFASWNSYGPSFYGTGFCFSSNGGSTWTGNYTMTPSSGDPGPWIWPATSTYAGRLGLSFITSSYNMGATYSTDNGTTWVPGITFPGSTSANADKNLSAVDNVPGSPYFGRAYTVWSDFAGSFPNRIVASYTTNGGAAWSTEAPVSPPPAAGHHCQGCDVEVGPGGIVYVTWGHCTTNGQNSTEDQLGFAKSTDGGVTWVISNNNVVDINGIRTSNLFNGIRANGFPRIDVDKTGGAYNGYIYVTLAEKTVAPATDAADATLCRSTDGGTTWTHTRVNQDTPGNGRYQYFPAVVVSGDGGVNISYYDQRNTTGYITEYWLSRSINGGTSWTDVVVSDHTFTPAPIPGLAGGYQGDYTGITFSASRLFPFWADNSSGIYQVWTAGIDLGPAIAHTPLPNTENLAGPYVVNCTITPAGSAIDPARTRVCWSRNNPVITDSVLMTNTSGNNWTANIPGNGVAATYRYFITTTDMTNRRSTSPPGAPGSLYSFQAAADLVKPVITHTPLGDVPRTNWPATVVSTITDNIGIDSGWVRWYKNNPGTGTKHFKLNNTSGNTFQALFNSDTSQVAYNDSIFYRIIAQDNSSNHNKDSTALYKFKITAIANACIGTGTTAVGWPYYTFYHDSRTQMLYTKAEILAGGGSSGTITRIGFNVASAASQMMNGFNIKMQHTSLTSLSSFITTGFSTAYTGTYTVPGTGWQFIDLQSPFYYNGVDNLLIEICFDNTSYTSNTTVNSSTTTGTMTYHYHVDGSTGCTMTGTNSATSRPNICMVENLFVGTQNQQIVIPDHFSLLQNYPNPFNPSTGIKFNIPKQTFVKLTVYDILGREVITLVNEMKKPGPYEVKFDGAGYASGIYIYKIEAGDFTDVKKMVLLK